MRRLYFGGSFNPIHHGHLICARAVAEARQFEQVGLVPSAQPPHKQGTSASELAEPRHRLEMCRLAAAGQDDLFTVDDLELRRPGSSYSYDTAQALKARGEGNIHWLIGADMLLYLPKWHRAEELVRAVNFLVMARPGWTLDWRQVPEPFRHLQQNVVVAPLIEISASDIRQRCEQKRSITYLLPETVRDYILANGLYR